MRALVIQKPGDPEVLGLQQRPEPGPLNDTAVRVQVKAVGLNRADTLQRKGFYPAPPGYPPDIPGLEFAGEVVELGADVHQRRLGERVMGITGGGSCAETLILPADQLLPVPEHFSWEMAGGFAEAQLTAFDALKVQANLQPGQWLLIHAVGSGVGLAALQQARVWDVRTIGTARSDWKLAQARLLGLEQGVLVDDGRFQDAVHTLTGGQGVDVVLDFMGASYFEQNLQVLRRCGTLIHLALMGGSKTSLPLDQVLMKRLTIRGSTLRARSLSEKAALVSAFVDTLGSALNAGKLDPVIDEVFSMEQAAQAHRRMEANQNLGKIVLRWD